mmetsp:Transcript_12743/g.32646  ORF Transcript_12743/g.32646 Transcript_12743/m.32646 type:complete len:274 (-) Transcript_12743:815-1636(-)
MITGYPQHALRQRRGRERDMFRRDLAHDDCNCGAGLAAGESDRGKGGWILVLGTAGSLWPVALAVPIPDVCGRSLLLEEPRLADTPRDTSSRGGRIWGPQDPLDARCECSTVTTAHRRCGSLRSLWWGLLLLLLLGLGTRSATSRRRSLVGRGLHSGLAALLRGLGGLGSGSSSGLGFGGRRGVVRRRGRRGSFLFFLGSFPSLFGASLHVFLDGIVQRQIGRQVEGLPLPDAAGSHHLCQLLWHVARGISVVLLLSIQNPTASAIQLFASIV